MPQPRDCFERRERMWIMNRTSIMNGLSMHPSRLLLFFLIATSSLTGMAEAQPCYKKTDEHVAGNFFVKPMTDSTCFGQYYASLRYYNYKTGVTFFSFLSEAYYPHPHFGRAFVTGVLMFDSLLVVSWEKGDVYRILKVDYLGIVSEIPTALDSIPLLKFGVVGVPQGRKLNVVNDSIFLMSNNTSIYSFNISGNTVACVDSMTIQRPWSALDLYGDTIIVIYGQNYEARFYHVDAGGRIAYSTTVGIDSDVWDTDNVYYRYGNLYVGDGTFWRALVRTHEGFKLTPGSAEDWTFGVTLPLFGKQTVIIFGWVNDELWVYDRELNLLCNKIPVSSPGAIASGIYGDKVFTAISDTIFIWIPDTSTTSITSSTVANRPSGLEVWPNPSASGMITVRSEEQVAAIELTDANGRIVYRTSQPGVGATIIPTALFPAGVYFVNAHTAQGIMSERVVILRERD